MDRQEKATGISILLTAAGLGLTLFIGYSDPNWIPEEFHLYIAIFGLVLFGLGVVGVFVPLKRLGTIFRRAIANLRRFATQASRLRVKIYKAPRAVTIDNRRPANPESFERLRELWKPAARTAQFVEDCLAVTVPEFGARTGIKRVAAELLQPQMETLRAALNGVGDKVRVGGSTTSDLENLQSLLCTFFKLYHNVARWWIYIETDVHAENQSDFLRSEKYEQFHKRHESLCVELERLRARSDFKDVVPEVGYFSPGGIPDPR